MLFCIAFHGILNGCDIVQSIEETVALEEAITISIPVVQDRKTGIDLVSLKKSPPFLFSKRVTTFFYKEKEKRV